MKTKISKKLRAARALISDETCWTQGTRAATADGAKCDLMHPAATRFCALGAIGRCSGYGPPAAVKFRHAVETLTGDFSAALFNDTHTHDEVLWAFDLAIAFEEVGT